MCKVYYLVESLNKTGGIIFPFESEENYYCSNLGFYIEDNDFKYNKIYSFSIKVKESIKEVKLEKVSKTRLSAEFEGVFYKFRLSSENRIQYVGRSKKFEGKKFVRIFPLNYMMFEKLYKESKVLFLGHTELE
ncbi:MAG: hypothetical protein ACRDAQ_00300 [Cetobacterium sp.]